MKTLLVCLFVASSALANTRSDEYTQNFTSQTWIGSGLRIQQGLSDNIPNVYTMKADSTTATNTIALSPLAFTLQTNSTYYFDCQIGFRTAATTTGIGLGVRIPASPVDIAYTATIPSAAADGAGTSVEGHGTAPNDMIIGTGVQATTATYLAHLLGLFVTGTGGGRFTVLFQSEVNTSAVTLKTGSNCRLYTANEP